MPSLPGKLYAPLDWLKTNVFLWPYLGMLNLTQKKDEFRRCLSVLTDPPKYFVV